MGNKKSIFVMRIKDVVIKKHTLRYKDEKKK